MLPIARTLLRYRGALVVVFLQAAPVDVRTNANGRFSLAIGFGGDRYDQEQFGCDGSVIESRTVQSKTMSGVANVPLRGNWSLEAMGGNTSLDGPVCTTSTCVLPPAFKGGFGGMRFRSETEDAGFAIGVMSLPGVDIDYTNSTYERTRDLSPTVLVRVGSIAAGRRHFRLEYAGLPIPGSPPLTTIGFGSTGREAEPTRGFLGLAIPAYSAAENGNLLLRAELMIPIGGHVSLNLGASGNSKILNGSGGVRVSW